MINYKNAESPATTSQAFLCSMQWEMIIITNVCWESNHDFTSSNDLISGFIGYGIEYGYANDMAKEFAVINAMEMINYKNAESPATTSQAFLCSMQWEMIIITNVCWESNHDFSSSNDLISGFIIKSATIVQRRSTTRTYTGTQGSPIFARK